MESREAESSPCQTLPAEKKVYGVLSGTHFGKLELSSFVLVFLDYDAQISKICQVFGPIFLYFGPDLHFAIS